jgi:hypothetical protein
MGLKKSQWYAAVAAGVVAAGALVFLSLNSKMLQAKSGSVVTVKTTPASVMLKLDGADLFDGHFKETPVEIPMKRGRHMLKIVRAGFASQIINIEVTSERPIRLENLALGIDPSYRSTPVRITGSLGNQKLRGSIDNGFAEEIIPFIAHDLEVSQLHTLRIFDENSNNRLVHHCLFRFGKENDETAEIRLSYNQQHLSTTNCSPVK